MQIRWLCDPSPRPLPPPSNSPGDLLGKQKRLLLSNREGQAGGSLSQMQDPAYNSKVKTFDPVEPCTFPKPAGLVFSVSPLPVVFLEQFCSCCPPAAPPPLLCAPQLPWPCANAAGVPWHLLGKALGTSAPVLSCRTRSLEWFSSKKSGSFQRHSSIMTNFPTGAIWINRSL